MRLTVFISIVLACLAGTLAFAQKTKTASGSFTYIIPDDQTMEEARQVAIDMCKKTILQSTFGTYIHSTEIARIEDGTEGYLQESVSDVKGEWLETVGDPKFTRQVVNDQFALSVYLTGKVREIVFAQTDVKAFIARKYENTFRHADTFSSGDNFYLTFQTSEPGYVIAYLTDDHTATCLLPYYTQQQTCIPVEANVEYVFFSRQNNVDNIPDYAVMEYVAHTDKKVEMDKLHVLFSPNAFSKPIGRKRSDSEMETLPKAEFDKWLGRVRNQDPQMVVRSLNLIIEQNSR